MKIALVIERMDPRRGGRETSTAQMACELARRGHAVTVLCRRGAWSGGNVTVRPLTSGGLSRVGRRRRFVTAAQEHILATPYDIVHATLPLPGANVYQPRGGTIPAQLAASLRRRSVLLRPLVHLARPLNRSRLLLGRLERQVVADDNVLCLAVSAMVAEEFARYYRRTEHVRVVFNGVEVPAIDAGQAAAWRGETRSHLCVGEGDAVFLTVATNFPLKGVAEAIESFARWYHGRSRRAEAKLVVVGRALVEAYHRHAALRGVGAAVVFVPPTEDIFRWYAAADACLLLSWYDPCSRVVLEATRWGIPSITTAFNGAAAVLRRGAGHVVPSPRAKAAIVGAMDELADPVRRAPFVAACRGLAGELSMSRHVDQLLAAYGQLLGQS
ncbi:MAG: glycosyltransferase family 4 protein [Phycisphaerae bacterium]|nr:glycosyltransferase family 4 protein [Phycisphaerae bacterium]